MCEGTKEYCERQYYRVGYQYPGQVGTMVDEEVSSLASIGFLVVMMYIFMPIRSCINCVVGDDHDLEPQYNKAYEEVYKSFASYYDKENPITQKKG